MSGVKAHLGGWRGIALFAFAVLVVWLAGRGLPDGRLHVYFLDVGQGDAIFIRTPDGRQILIDGGPGPTALLNELGEVMPFWDRSLDLVVLTHPDADHMSGLMSVLERFRVRQVLDTYISDMAPEAASWRDLLSKAGVPRVYARPGMRLPVGDLSLTVLHAGPPRQPGEPADTNNDGIVLRVDYGETGFLLTADAGETVEAGLLASGVPLQRRRVEGRAPRRQRVDFGALRGCRGSPPGRHPGRRGQSFRPSAPRRAAPAGRHLVSPHRSERAGRGDQRRQPAVGHDGAAFSALIPDSGHLLTHQVETLMRLLMFMARRFWWKSYSKTLEQVEDVEAEEAVDDAVVVFMHVEARDGARHDDVFRKTLKNVKWLANKRELRRVVLHSFTHLGGENAEPEFASAFIDELAERLRATGYQVWITPFGYFNEWDLNVYGESLGKVWKEI